MKYWTFNGYLEFSFWADVLKKTIHLYNLYKQAGDKSYMVPKFLI